MSKKQGPGEKAGPYREADFLPLSGLAQITFCPRRFSLIQVEGLWRENLATAQGRDLHETVHQEGNQDQNGLHIAKSLRLFSFSLGLSGVTDVVEFHPGSQGQGCTLPERQGRWRPVPVEYKRGKPRPDICYQVQLCGQAICLEEMLGTKVESGFLFHWQTRRRKEVRITADLRQKTIKAACEMHQIFTSGQTPAAGIQPKCKGCSLFDLCQPKTLAKGKNPMRYMAQALAKIRE